MNDSKETEYDDFYCSQHKPKSKEMFYREYHDWMDKMSNLGHKQSMCPVCKKWLFKCEWGKKD